ncbi:hypothetical protein HYH02_012975 [Chlamydomonas schloesseri]|uniref:Uncharacterized protein n=1 Tax=Chlamydomonas schloesseri TaxID=2026947 RepID=A0A835W0E9_9CHLO|nr:hypothetical protein HYH02_012975 [Chlamydomonas schloesseri]|eukprot:KAG2432404.1 hypothetical protein HYH02_012975 [Chlamydomonas schloesseri]
MHGPPVALMGDQELFSEVLKVQNKIFYLDLKENGRGKYIKIAEKGKYRPKSSVVVPLSGLHSFIQLFDFYMNTEGPGPQSRDVVVESKVFNFSCGENDRGRFLRIFESGGGYPAGGSSLMVPAGWGNANIRAFRESFEKIASWLSQTGMPTIDMSSGLALTSKPDAVTLDVSKEGGPVLSVGSKHFFFDARMNDRGRYLKIKEVSGNMKTLLVVPAHAVAQFQEAISIAMMAPPRPDNEPGGAGPGGMQPQGGPGGMGGMGPGGMGPMGPGGMGPGGMGMGGGPVGPPPGVPGGPGGPPVQQA